MSVRAVARTLHHSRRKVREALACPEPQPYTRRAEPPAPRLGAFHAIIDAILAADEQAPRKQRHTMRQVFRRLGAEHDYPGSYDAVRRYIGKRQRRSRETFIPLSHDPGQRLECDFGHIYVDFPDGRRQVAVLIAVWAYSYCPFAIALPTERTEAILAGMVEAFEFFGCVPREVWWDNPTTVVAEIFKGRSRRPHPRYAALASHYNFEPLFCMPARGNEKPHVENRVYDLQRRWATPVPRMRDVAERNAYLRPCCLKDRERTVAGQTQTIGQRFEQDRAAALALPARRFDACIHQVALADKYQMVRFDSIRYSVPRTCAFQAVTVKGYVDHVEVVCGGQIVARPARSSERGQQVLDPLHYLVTLGRRPAALDHSNVYRQWRLPANFSTLRQRLEARHGPAAGARQYIRVLQLLATHPVERIRQVIGRCGGPEDLHADRIAQQVQRLAEREVPGADLSLSPDGLLSVQVPPPDLSRFDQLLSQGELIHA
jgi:transposase